MNGPLISFQTPRGRLLIGITTASLVVLCAVLAIFFDRDIALAIREAMPRDTRKMFSRITEYGRTEYYLVIILPLWVFARWAMMRSAPRPVARAWWDLARINGYLVATLVFSGVLVQLTKLTVGRARPKMLFNEEIYGAFPLSFDTSLSSFPSGHSQSICAIMTCLAILFPRGWPIFLLWALVIVASRVITGAHFPSDVIMGSFVGALSAVYVKERWYGDLKAPKFTPYLDYGDAR